MDINEHFFDGLIGKGMGPRTMNYGWRDVSLYALGVGASKNDLPYFFEKNKDGMKALPTFSLLPYINTINMEPYRHVPYGPNELVSDYIVEHIGYTPNRLHMAMDLTIHGPIDAYGGTFLTEDRVNAVYDRGEGKGVVADCAMEIYDRAGRHISTIHSYHWHKALGGFGGPKFDSQKVDYPDRAPDYEATEFMVDNLACIYRLSGDTYEVHVDPEISGKYGYEMPFMQGLCTYGFATRMLIGQVIPYQPEKVKHIYAQMRNVCYPGRNMTLQAWKLEEGRLCFKLLDEEGRLLLGNGLFEYEV